MAKDFDDSDGVWRTIAGRKVFIREGQSLSSAMKQSGKFKSGKKEKMQEIDKKIKNHQMLNEEEFAKKIQEIQDRPSYKEKMDKAVQELNEKYGYTKDKNLSDLNKERDEKFKEIVEANSSRQDIYENATSDEAYKNLYGKEREKNAKTELNEKDYKRFEELTNKYHEGRKELASIDKKIDEYRKNNPKETENKKDNYVSGWERLEKNRQQIKAEALKAGKSVEEYEKEKTNEMFGKKESSNNWKSQIEKNNASMEKDVTDLQNKINEYRNRSINAKDGLERYQLLKEADNLTNQYYERFRENERANAKIKVEEPNEKYMNVQAYAGYKDKFNDTWGKDGSNDKVVSAKMYTNDEFMEHLEDANWHSERKQLLEANLTNKELSYIKDRTKVSAWGVDNLTGKEQVSKLIEEAKNQNNKISNSLRQKAYQKYLKEHPTSKMTFNDFKDMYSK